MRNYVISLERTPERLDAFRRANDGLIDWEWSPAVDGKALPQRDPAVFGVKTSFSPGGIGCALSHLGLWRQIAASGEPGTIFEDDAVLSVDFVARRDALLAALPSGWDFVMWGFNFDSLLNVDMGYGLGATSLLFNEVKMREGLEQYRHASVDARLFRLNAAFGIMAYSISAKGAADLLQRALPIMADQVYVPGLDLNMVNFNLDVLLNGYYSVIEAYACFPPIAISPNDKTISTVGSVATIAYPRLKVGQRKI